MGDWQALFGFSISPVEIVLRGTVMFWFLFAIFRFVLRRDVGNVGIGDFLFVVIVADASQNAMTGESRTVIDGMLLVATLVAWNFLVDYLSYRIPLIRHLAEPPSVMLVKNGRMLTRNLRREYISRSEILMKMREQGIARLEDIKEMRLESDGDISVIKND